MNPLYQIQGCLNNDKQRTVLVPSSRDVNFVTLSKVLDDIVKNGWEKDKVREAWLYEDGELVAYVHRNAFQRDMVIIEDGWGDAKGTAQRFAGQRFSGNRPARSKQR